METNFQPDINTTAGTAGGTLIIIVLQINAFEIMHTALLAAIGATVSFCVSMVLKWLIGKTRKKKN